MSFDSTAAYWEACAKEAEAKLSAARAVYLKGCGQWDVELDASHALADALGEALRHVLDSEIGGCLYGAGVDKARAAIARWEKERGG